jgi:hypothetical protein
MIFGIYARALLATLGFLTLATSTEADGTFVIGPRWSGHECLPPQFV